MNPRSTGYCKTPCRNCGIATVSWCRNCDVKHCFSCATRPECKPPFQVRIAAERQQARKEGRKPEWIDPPQGKDK